MRIDVTQASPADAPVLKQLGQLYEYDFSEFCPADVEDDGRFTSFDLYFPRAFEESGWSAFLVRVDGRLAGFALVAPNERYPDCANAWYLSEFFVMRRYRRQGVGRHIAFDLFDRFPGRWEVGQIPQNDAARAFWRRVIAEYTNGHFDDVTEDSEWFRGTYQRFVSDGHPARTEEDRM